MPGSIEFDGYGIAVDDLAALNGEPETRRLRLQYEIVADALSGSAHGNVAAYRLVVRELRQHLTRGGVQCTVALSTGEERRLLVSPDFVIEDGEDATELFD